MMCLISGDVPFFSRGFLLVHARDLSRVSEHRMHDSLGLSRKRGGYVRSHEVLRLVRVFRLVRGVREDKCGYAHYNEDWHG